MSIIGRILISGTYVALLNLNISVANAESFTARASWRLFDNNIIAYLGTGDSKGAALEDARQSCLNRQLSNEWKAYCYQAPVSITFQKIEQCEPRWSSCIGWGEGVGNPCDEGCYRGNQIEENLKPFCTEHRFQCLRNVDNPSIFLKSNDDQQLKK